jgi:hypothetical protein
MQITIRPLDIVSRVIAVLLVGLPLAWVSMQIGDWEMREVVKMNHAQLLDYIKEGHHPSFAGNYGMILLLTFLYVGICEGVALVCRLGVRAVHPDNPARASRSSFEPVPAGHADTFYSEERDR